MKTYNPLSISSKILKKTPGLRAASVALVSLMTFSVSADARAKYEPEDGSIYYGYCAAPYWSEEALTETVDAIYDEVSDKPFLLYSMFVHAMEKGRWNGWEYQKEGPNGKPIHGSGEYIKSIRDKGFTPVVAWTWMDWLDHSQSPSMHGLLKGEYDWYLDDWIEGIKEFGDPIFIRLSHEMDGSWYPYSEGYDGSPHPNTAEDYIAYWQYVVDRFRAAGVENVAWVWNVSGSRQGKRDWIDYYPGDEYVDWIAVDVYSNKDGGQTLLDFQAAMGTDKPIMIPEGGTEDLLTPYHPNYPGNIEWIREFYDTILHDMNDQVKAVMWFQWNEHSYVQRDPSQVPTYRDYIERDAFISELALGGESGGSDIPVQNPDAAAVLAPASMNLPLDGQTYNLDAEFAGYAGETGSKWHVEEGDASGLEIAYKDNRGQVRGLKAGHYRLKIEAWDKNSNHASAHVDVTVGEPTTEPGARVDVPETLEITVNSPAKTVHADLIGFDGKFGGRWSIESGNPDGLVLTDNLTAATVRGTRVGTYKLKAQFWNSEAHESDHLTVIVTEERQAPDEDEANTAEPAIVGPDWVEIVADGSEFALETTYASFTPKGGKWTLEIGDPEGLVINGKGEIVGLVAEKAGEYVIKTQAWASGIHVSKHIRVTAVAE